VSSERQFHSAKPREAKAYRIEALERGLSVLDLLADVPDLSLVDIAARLDLPRGTALRHLSVLESRGLVARDLDSKRFRLGPKLIAFGHAARNGLTLREVAGPVIASLRDVFNETTHLGILSAGEVVHVDVAPSAQLVKMAAAVGERTCAHGSSLGKALLAWSGADAVEGAVLRCPIPGCRAEQRPSIAEFRLELEAVRAKGYAFDDEESGPGVRCVGSPIFDGAGRPIAAVSVSSPADRFPRKRIPSVALEVVRSAREISAALGWGGQPPEYGLAV
jgi:IclR family acetate operon transcriptional repressor